MDETISEFIDSLDLDQTKQLFQILDEDDETLYDRLGERIANEDPSFFSE